MSSPNRSVPFKDATIRILSSSKSYEENTLRNKPHETVKCQFRINSLNVIAGACSSFYIDTSEIRTKLPDSQPLLIEALLGITSVTEVDRIIDFCLTKLTKLETASFSIETRTGEHFTISLELVEFEDNYEELFCKDPSQLITFASQLKTDGVQLFKEKRIKDAFTKFAEACKFLIFIDPKTTEHSVLQDRDELLANLYNNLAGCHVIQENWSLVIWLCNLVLQKQQQNVKAHYRRGISFMELQEFEKARVDLNLVMEQEPSNSIAKHKLAILDEKERCLNLKYASAMKKMFR